LTIQFDRARPTPPPWLKPGHHAAGDPEIGQAADRADQRIAVGREGEGTVDDLLDAGLGEAGEMLEADFERRRDAVEVRRQATQWPKSHGVLTGDHGRQAFS
jgi:hypothetical protein